MKMKRVEKTKLRAMTDESRNGGKPLAERGMCLGPCPACLPMDPWWKRLPLHALWSLSLKSMIVPNL